jgi:hypothetical protein
MQLHQYIEALLKNIFWNKISCICKPVLIVVAAEVVVLL